MARGCRLGVFGGLALATFVWHARAGAVPDRAAQTIDDAVRSTLPPWGDPGDIPIPLWARSVVTTKQDAPVFQEPGGHTPRRGSVVLGARLAFYATKLADGCGGRWFAIGPAAWVCSDVAEFSREAPLPPPVGASDWFAAWASFSSTSEALPSALPLTKGDDGLPYRYYFVRTEGAYEYATLEDAEDDIPERDLERGFGIVITEQKAAFGRTWGRTKRGRWVAMDALAPARPSLFHGERIEGPELAVAWVSADRARVFDSEKVTKVVETKLRFARLSIHGQVTTRAGTLLRISKDDEPARFVREKDVSWPRKARAPEEIGGAQVSPNTRWIDVDLAQQTLTAYVGEQPVFATLVSTGRGPSDSETGTRPGVHRIWVKVFTTKMDNLEREDLEDHYAIEDVPWVQFFDKGIALHGAFWHRDFGRVHSHGCVNLSPLDARWLFAFTAPHLPRGWSAVHPTLAEPSTVVRVR